MIIVIGEKLRKLLPDGVFDSTSDPLARDHATTVWKDGDWSDPADPDKMIWCAELTSAGRGRGKKSGIVLMSANCGFVVICPVPPVPELRILSEEEMAHLDWSEQRSVENKNSDMMKRFRTQLETMLIATIRDGLLSFSLPENRVLDYTDTVSRVELVKGKASTPTVRLEEFIERELDWSPGDDPVAQYNIRSNWTTRKFGNSGSYRHVDAHICHMLGMNDEECQKWLMDFLAPMRETITRPTVG